MKKIFTLALFTIAFEYLSAQICIENTNSLGFDGFSSFASPVNQTNLNITDSLTIEAWINPASFAFNSANNSIVCKHGWSSGEGGFVLRSGGAGEVSFNIAGLDPGGNPTSWKEVLSPTNVLTLNTWTHVAGTYDGTNIKLFVNGVEQNITPFAGSIIASPNYPLTIGKLSDPGQFAQRFFDGLIDEVRIWHRALPAAELMANMNKHIDPTTAADLISYWRFNEGTGATSIDLKSGNDATLNINSWNALVPFNQVPPIPTITFNGGVLTASTSGQWYLDGVAIAGATNLDYTPIANGDYTFTTDPNAAACTNTSAIITIANVGINNNYNNIEIKIFPNPINTNEALAIQSTKNYEATSLMISDVAGRKVYNEQGLTIKTGVTQIKLNSSVLTQGIYFYELVSNNSSIAKGKLMVK